MKKLFVLILSVLSIGFVCTDIVSAQVGQPKTFTITGYYSPLPDQEFFLTGSYESEIRLNGRGTNGADGTPVFPGMIAAPSTMAFGTKVCIPQFGCGEVHDRGGAIVNQGERNLAKYDRLDLWLGYGDEGLRRALAWGVRHLDCELYDANAPISPSVNFEVPMPLAGIIELPNKQTFPNNLWLGQENEDVIKLQEALAKLALYDGEMSGKYDEFLATAVFNFQKKYFILESESDSGAGVFGPKTRVELGTTLFHFETQEKIREMWESFQFEKNISRGERNADVLKLQQMLVTTEYMDVLPTGFFGPKTQSALVEFQKDHGIIEKEGDIGSGKVGPETRDLLNTLLEENKGRVAIEKVAMVNYQKQEQLFQVLVGNATNLNQASLVLNW
jgi:peptidoglycan hydrolase-like protein with peptidoglycan-binding domain/3D (Asp-Asp-Asp) domain-containing protein